MKKLINNTVSDILISDMGLTVPASGEVVVDPSQYTYLTQSNDIIVSMSSGDITYNDGTNDLSLADATQHINGYLEKTERSLIQGAQHVISHKAEETSFARATHDFCDKTTWYSDSIRVLTESPTKVGLVCTMANTYLIDVVSGIVNRQDLMQGYRVVVYDDATEISGYTVNHVTGIITLDEEPSGSITVDYSYATTSGWSMVPDPGKMLIIEHSEVQFSTDILMQTPIRFEIWVYNPMDLPNKVPYQVVQYNSIRDLVNEANLGTGTIPAMVGFPECAVFPFNYATIKPIQSSVGAELRIRTVDDLELGGSFGTATFYLVTRDE